MPITQLQNVFRIKNKAFVEIKPVIVRECGFINFLLKFEEEYISGRNEKAEERRNLCRGMSCIMRN